MSGLNACRAVLLAVLLPVSATPWAHTTGGAPEQLGKVAFANSCLPAVQPALERGVALLHSFSFREGEKVFRDVLARDPDCAIAGWGIASTLIGNTFAVGPNPAQAQQAREAIERGRATARKTERERYFIEAIAEYYEQYYRGLYGAGQAAAQANNRDKARYYFSRLLEMAGPGVRSSDVQAVRQYVASN